MATLQTGALMAFSIENFVKLFEESQMKKYLASSDIAQIYEAVEGKNEGILRKIFTNLLKAKAADDKIMEEFANSKNKMMDDFVIGVTTIKKNLIEGPRKKRVAKAESRERARAEKILNQL